MSNNHNHTQQKNDEQFEKAKQRAKQEVKNFGKQQAKKIASMALRKVSAFLFSKFGLILCAILALVIMLLLFVALITPDMSTKSKVPNDIKVELTQEQLQRYATLTYKYNILDVRYSLMLDMGKYENEHMLEYSPDESSFMLFDMEYDEYIPPLKKCVIETEVTNEDGTTTITSEEVLSPMIEGEQLLDNCVQHSKKRQLVYHYLQTKDAILSFMDSKDALTIEGKEPKRKFTVDDSKLYYPFNPYEQFITVDIFYHGTEIDEAIEEGKYTKEQKEHVQMVLEVPEAVDELFAEYGISIVGSYLAGSGAYCVQDGDVNPTSIESVLNSSGVFKGHTQTFIDTASKYNIDVVLMIAIALHETGNGTSNAVVNKNNPGGLMNPATNSTQLFVYSTLEQGIDAMARTLNNRINKDGLVTIESLGNVYAPVGAGNDPNNLNQHWVGNVGKNVAQLGGLTMNCENYSSTSIAFNGDVSQARQVVASVGTKFIGRSTYVFGGGRNQNDIARGYFDCSSFVHWAYAQAGIDLGNLSGTSTETLNKMGQKISLSEIQVGDLVFWDTYKRDGHVAIYVGNGQFIGAQSSKGVEIVSLSNPYWKSKFSGHVRRLLD